MIDILKHFTYQKIITDQAERFDLFQGGIFETVAGQEQVELVRLEPNTKYVPHYHQKSSAVIYIIAGTGELLLNETGVHYQAGKRIEISAGTWHGFNTERETVFLSIQSPSILDPLTGIADIHYE